MKQVSQMLNQSLLSPLWNFIFPNRYETVCLRKDAPQNSQRIKKAASVPVTSRWSNAVSLTDHLVATTSKNLQFWREKSSSWTSTTKEGSDLDYPSCIHSSRSFVHGKSRTFLVTGTWEGDLSVWNENGDIVCEEKQAHADCILAICSWSCYLATADFSGNVKVWKIYQEPAGLKISLETSRRIESSKIHSLLAVSDGDCHNLIVASNKVTLWDSKLQNSRVLQGSSTLFTDLCQFQNWIAAGSLEGNIFLWNLDGTLEKKLEVGEYIFSLEAWNDFLCIGLMSKILLWEPSENSVTSLEGTHTMTVHKDQLVTCTDKEIIFYHSRTGWNSVKVLWAGYLKETSEDCNLAVLPPEMFRMILSYL